MTAPDALLAALHLHQAVVMLPSWLDRAVQEELGDADFLGGVLEEEVAARTTADLARSGPAPCRAGTWCREFRGGHRHQ